MVKAYRGRENLSDAEGENIEGLDLQDENAEDDPNKLSDFAR